MVEIFIGGWCNTKSVIRQNKQKPDFIESVTPNILSASEFRGFWIRWTDNVREYNFIFALLLFGNIKVKFFS